LGVKTPFPPGDLSEVSTRSRGLDDSARGHPMCIGRGHKAPAEAQPNTCDRHPMTDRPSRFAPHRSRQFRPLWIALGCCLCLSPAAMASELRDSPIVKAVQRVRDSVVNIRGEKTVAATEGPAAAPDATRRVNGMGTGVVIDARDTSSPITTSSMECATSPSPWPTASGIRPSWSPATWRPTWRSLRSSRAARCRSSRSARLPT